MSSGVRQKLVSVEFLLDGAGGDGLSTVGLIPARLRWIEGRLVMGIAEETIEATLDPNGQLRLSQKPQLPPGPVRVTIRVATSNRPQQRGLADVIREIATDQRSRGFPGRSAVDVLAEDDARQAEDAERDGELDAARRGAAAGGP
jgi:hypothetical protein